MALGLLQERGLKQGELAQVQLVKILGYLYARKKTGCLALTRGRASKEIFFFNGMPWCLTEALPGP